MSEKHNYKKDDHILIKGKVINTEAAGGEILVMLPSGYKHVYVDPGDIIKADETKEAQLLIKQHAALLDRFDVAMKALEHISKSSIIKESFEQELADIAIEKINKMIKDYNDENEIRGKWNPNSW